MVNNDVNTGSFIGDFFKRKGAYILSSIIISKILTFLLSFFVVHHLTTDEYGNISYAYNIVSFVVPFMGLGIYQSLGRFGPISKSQLDKRRLFKFTFRRGIVASLLVIGLILLFSGLLTKTLPNAHEYLIYFSFLILSLFMLESVKILYRIYGLNKLFAYVEIAHSFVLIILGVILTYYWGGLGYIVALIGSPLIMALYVSIRYGLIQKTPPTDYSKEEKSEFWKYGFFTSIGGLSSKLLFSIDILMIGFLIQNETEIAFYKVASLIPFSLLFIPNGFIKTDIIKITQEYQNKAFLSKYIKNYMLTFTIISIVIAGGLILFAEPLMMLFGNDYKSAANLMPVFSIGIIGAFVFRNLFGNLLDAVGWSQTSAGIATGVLLLDIVLNYFMVKNYGIIGAAYSTSILLWGSGIISGIAIAIYLRKLK
jgi:O-antigen/teichoic acid export membrane protein